MIRRATVPDLPLLIIISTLALVGLFVFMSASFGLLTREGASWSSVLFSQIVLGFGGGLVLGIGAYYAPLPLLRKFAFPIYILALLLCALVFVPGFGLSAGGATRWIVVAGISFQPAEFLKIALILLLSAWGVTARDGIATFRRGLLPLLILVGAPAALLLAQPDTGTFLTMLSVALALYLIAGGRIKYFVILIGCAVLLVALLALMRPYVRERIVTYFNAGSDPTGRDYQFKQALISIGSGETFGRGFGQSVQKFQHLPEPIGDSIFAVLGEEFGFLGTASIVALFLLFCLRGLHIAARAPDPFNRLLAAGIAIMITSQAFIHIGSLTGILPLTGIPLPLVSHGGTSLMFTLASLGLLLQISKFKRQT